MTKLLNSTSIPPNISSPLTAPESGAESPWLAQENRKRFATAIEHHDPNRLIGKKEFSRICGWAWEKGTPTLNRRMKNDPRCPTPLREWKGGSCKWPLWQVLRYRNIIYAISPA